MILDLVLKNARIITSTGITSGDLGILNGKIFSTGKVSEKSRKERDCTGLFILPGAIDMHVHFRDPGFPEKEDFETGSAAAIAGGVTTVIDMPNTDPPTVTAKALEEKRAIAAAKSHANYGFYFGYTGDNLDEVKKVKNIAGVKVFTGSSTGNLLVQDHHLIEKLFKLGKLVIVHAEKESIIRENTAKYKDENDPSVHSLIRGRRAAYEEVKELLHCAKKSNARIHITHVSTLEEVKELEKFQGPTVSADCTTHHLYLTEKAYADRANYVKVNPPLRTNADREALWKGLRKGIIQAIATDHAPHTKEEKERLYKNAPSGVPGVETLLPLLLDSANHGDISLRDIVKFTAENPARILGIKNKGRIEAGYDADITIVNMHMKKEVGAHLRQGFGGQANGFFTKCGWSPYEGWKLQGWPVVTLVGGNVVFEKGKILMEKTGREVVFS